MTWLRRSHRSHCHVPMKGWLWVHWLLAVLHRVVHVRLLIRHSMLILHGAIVDLLFTGRWHEVAMLSMLWITCWLVDKPGGLRLLHGVGGLHFNSIELYEVVILVGIRLLRCICVVLALICAM
jgi:hypothetical protein